MNRISLTVGLMVLVLIGFSATSLAQVPGLDVFNFNTPSVQAQQMQTAVQSAPSADALKNTLMQIFGSSGNQPNRLAAMGNFSRTTQQVVAGTTVWSKKIREVLMKESAGVFHLLLFPIIMAEIFFVGIRIMMRQPVIEQMARLTIITFILIIVHTVVSSNDDKNIMLITRNNLIDGGRAIGKVIITSCGTDRAIRSITTNNTGANGDAGEPMNYWMNYIGCPSDAQTPNASTGQDHYLFDTNYMLNRIWNDQTLPDIAGGTSGNFVDKIKDSALGFMAVMYGFQVFGLFMMIASVHTAAVLAPAFGYIAIFVSSFVCFDVILACGKALLPLIYFRSFEQNQLWGRYLIILGGLALIPFFYYIFSAIGFVTRVCPQIANF